MSATMSSEGPCGVLPPLPSALHKPLATLQQSMRLMLRGHEEHRLQDILQMAAECLEQPKRRQHIQDALDKIPGLPTPEQLLGHLLRLETEHNSNKQPASSGSAAAAQRHPVPTPQQPAAAHEGANPATAPDPAAAAGTAGSSTGQGTLRQLQQHQQGPSGSAAAQQPAAPAGNPDKVHGGTVNSSGDGTAQHQEGAAGSVPAASPATMAQASGTEQGVDAARLQQTPAGPATAAPAPAAVPRAAARQEDPAALLPPPPAAAAAATATAAPQEVTAAAASPAAPHGDSATSTGPRGGATVEDTTALLSAVLKLATDDQEAEVFAGVSFLTQRTTVTKRGLVFRPQTPSTTAAASGAAAVAADATFTAAATGGTAGGDQEAPPTDAGTATTSATPTLAAPPAAAPGGSVSAPGTSGQQVDGSTSAGGCSWDQSRPPPRATSDVLAALNGARAMYHVRQQIKLTAAAAAAAPADMELPFTRPQMPLLPSGATASAQQQPQSARLPDKQQLRCKVLPKLQPSEEGRPNLWLQLGDQLSTVAKHAAERRPVTGDRQAALVNSVVNWHTEAAAEAKRRREEAMRQRLAALKSSDMAAYLDMVRSTANSKVQELLQQTDACLKTLAQKLAKAGAKVDLTAAEEEQGADAGTDQHMADGVLGSSAAWGRLAQQLVAGGVEQQPRMLKGGQLRDYQMHGLRWMVGLAQHGLNGILADEMGLGKTVQVIALICHLIEASATKGASTSSGTTSSSSGPGRYLICCPASVLPNWAAEVKRWAPQLKVVVYKGSAEAREDIYYDQVYGKSFHVLLTTYEYLMSKSDRPRLSRTPWQLLVVDEGHRLKNADCKLSRELKAYRTKSRLLLTGTPLQNKLEELWALLNFLMPDLFNSADDFDAWFGAPLQAIRDASGGAEAPHDSEAALLSQEEYLLVTNRLHQVLRPFVLRRLKDSVAKELPDKREVLLRCPLSPYQQLLTDLVTSSLVDEEGEVCKAKGINNTVMELRSICNHPYISRLHPAYGEDVLPAVPGLLPHVVRICGKMLMLDQVLLRLAAGRHKVLLFSTMTRALDVVEEHLAWRGWEYLRLDGGVSAAERGELVDRFNDPDSGVFLFLLSIRAGGVGLNLQAADTVIMYDSDWNPQIDLQAQARAHRIGQQREVLVVRLAAQGSIEEHILRVAEEKRKFADSSITGGFFDGKTSQEQRREFLLSILQGAGPSASTSAATLTHQQLNRLLARGPEEVELLDSKAAAWAGAAAGGGGDPAVASSGPAHAAGGDGAGAGGEASSDGDAAVSGPLAQLLTASDCQPLMDLAAEAAAPKPKDDPSLFGKGMRGLKLRPQSQGPTSQVTLTAGTGAASSSRSQHKTQQAGSAAAGTRRELRSRSAGVGKAPARPSAPVAAPAPPAASELEEGDAGAAGTTPLAGTSSRTGGNVSAAPGASTAEAPAPAADSSVHTDDSVGPEGQSAAAAAAAAAVAGLAVSDPDLEDTAEGPVPKPSARPAAPAAAAGAAAGRATAGPAATAQEEAAPAGPCEDGRAAAAEVDCADQGEGCAAGAAAAGAPRAAAAAAEEEEEDGAVPTTLPLSPPASVQVAGDAPALVPAAPDTCSPEPAAATAEGLACSIQPLQPSAAAGSVQKQGGSSSSGVHQAAAVLPATAGSPSAPPCTPAAGNAAGNAAAAAAAAAPAAGAAATTSPALAAAAPDAAADGMDATAPPPSPAVAMAGQSQLVPDLQDAAAAATAAAADPQDAGPAVGSSLSGPPSLNNGRRLGASKAAGASKQPRRSTRPANPAPAEVEQGEQGRVLQEDPSAQQQLSPDGSTGGAGSIPHGVRAQVTQQQHQHQPVGPGLATAAAPASSPAPAARTARKPRASKQPSAAVDPAPETEADTPAGRAVAADAAGAMQPAAAESKDEAAGGDNPRGQQLGQEPATVAAPHQLHDVNSDPAATATADAGGGEEAGVGAGGQVDSQLVPASAADPEAAAVAVAAAGQEAGSPEPAAAGSAASRATGRKGVYWRPSRKRWIVEYMSDGKLQYGGSYRTQADAEARLAACLEQLGAATGSQPDQSAQVPSTPGLASACEGGTQQLQADMQVPGAEAATAAAQTTAAVGSQDTASPVAAPNHDTAGAAAASSPLPLPPPPAAAAAAAVAPTATPAAAQAEKPAAMPADLNSEEPAVTGQIAAGVQADLQDHTDGAEDIQTDAPEPAGGLQRRKRQQKQQQGRQVRPRSLRNQTTSTGDASAAAEVAAAAQAVEVPAGTRLQQQAQQQEHHPVPQQQQEQQQDEAGSGHQEQPQNPAGKDQQKEPAAGIPQDHLPLLKGIHWRADRRKWVVRFEWGGSRYYEGCHATLEAAQAALEACIAKHSIPARPAHQVVDRLGQASQAAASPPAVPGVSAAGGASQPEDGAAPAAVAGGSPAVVKGGNPAAAAAAAPGSQCSPHGRPGVPTPGTPASQGTPQQLQQQAADQTGQLPQPDTQASPPQPSSAGEGQAGQLPVLKGIHWRADRRKWVVRFEWGGNRYYEGCHATLEAAQAALEACLVEHNIPARPVHLVDRIAPPLAAAWPAAAAAQAAAAEAEAEAASPVAAPPPPPALAAAAAAEEEAVDGLIMLGCLSGCGIDMAAGQEQAGAAAAAAAAMPAVAGPDTAEPLAGAGAGSSGAECVRGVGWRTPAASAEHTTQVLEPPPPAAPAAAAPAPGQLAGERVVSASHLEATPADTTAAAPHGQSAEAAAAATPTGTMPAAAGNAAAPSAASRGATAALATAAAAAGAGVQRGVPHPATAGGRSRTRSQQAHPDSVNHNEGQVAKLKQRRAPTHSVRPKQQLDSQLRRQQQEQEDEQMQEADLERQQDQEGVGGEKGPDEASIHSQHDATTSTTRSSSSSSSDEEADDSDSSYEVGSNRRPSGKRAGGKGRQGPASKKHKGGGSRSMGAAAATAGAGRGRTVPVHPANGPPGAGIHPAAAAAAAYQQLQQQQRLAAMAAAGYYRMPAAAGGMGVRGLPPPGPGMLLGVGGGPGAVGVAPSGASGVAPYHTAAMMQAAWGQGVMAAAQLRALQLQAARAAAAAAGAGGGSAAAPGGAVGMPRQGQSGVAGQQEGVPAPEAAGVQGAVANTAPAAAAAAAGNPAPAGGGAGVAGSLGRAPGLGANQTAAAAAIAAALLSRRDGAGGGAGASHAPPAVAPRGWGGFVLPGLPMLQAMFRGPGVPPRKPDLS